MLYYTIIITGSVTKTFEEQKVLSPSIAIHTTTLATFPVAQPRQHATE